MTIQQVYDHIEHKQNMLAHVFISGFVQGVGYRQFVFRQAQRLQLTGWVKNLLDNRVEAVFAGSKERIGQMISICRRGTFLSEVKNVSVFWEKNPPSGGEFKDFRII